MNTDAKQQNVDVEGMRKYCVVCGRELGRHIKTHCTDTSLVAIKVEGFFKKKTSFFALDGRSLNEDDLSRMKEAEAAKAAILEQKRKEEENELNQLHKELNSQSREERLLALQKIRQARLQGAIPYLIDLLKQLALPQSTVMECMNNKSFVLETLVVLVDMSADSNVNPELPKWFQSSWLQSGMEGFANSIASHYHDIEEFKLNVKIAESLVYLSARFGAQRKAFLCFWQPIEKRSTNLCYVLAADEIVKDEEQAKVAIPALVEVLTTAERSRWARPGEYGGILGAGIYAGKESMAIFKEMDQIVQLSPLILAPEVILSADISAISNTAAFMIAKRAYAAGLAKLITRFPSVVRDELRKSESSKDIGDKGYYWNVLALAFALSGDISIYERLKSAAESSAFMDLEQEFAIELTAFEGLIALANNDATAQRVDIQTQTRALHPKSNEFVSILVAHWMMDTKNPIYLPYLVQLTESSKDRLRLISLSALLALAKNGDASAYAKLQFVAQKDKEQHVRQKAKIYLDQVQAFKN